MRKFLVLTALFFLSCLSAQSQFIVADPGHIVATIANGGAIQQVKKTMEDINDVSNAINSTVNDIRELQRNVDKALWNVKSLLKDEKFLFSTINNELAYADLMPNDFGYYIKDLNLKNIGKLEEGYNNELVTVGAGILHDAFEYPLDEALPDKLQGVYDLISDRQQNRSNYRIMSDRKALQTALSYNKLADVILAKGTQLNEMLKRGINNGHGTGDSFKLTEGERLELMEVAAGNIRKAMELKMRCDEIIKKTVLESDPSISVGMQRYTRFMQLKSLAEQVSAKDGGE